MNKTGSFAGRSLDLTTRIILRGKLEQRLEKRGIIADLSFSYDTIDAYVYYSGPRYVLVSRTLKSAEDYQKFEQDIIETAAYLHKTWR